MTIFENIREQIVDKDVQKWLKELPQPKNSKFLSMEKNALNNKDKEDKDLVGTNFLKGLFKYVAECIFLGCLQKNYPSEGSKYTGYAFSYCLEVEMDNAPKVDSDDSTLVLRLGGGHFKLLPIQEDKYHQSSKEKPTAAAEK